MKSAPPRIAITGLGAVSALGDSCDSLWDGIEAGRDGIGAIARFDTAPFRVSVGATIPAYRDVEIAELSVGFRLCTDIAVAAAREAWRDARVDAAGLAPNRIGLCLGTLFVDATAGKRPTSAHQLAEAIADTLDIAGPRVAVATACASSTNAVGLAGDLLRMGAADLVLAGGVDVLNSLVFAGFHSLAVLSATTCAPFSEPVGTVLGEGAGFVVMESARRAAARAVPARAWYCGYGLSADAYHETSPDPSGLGVERALKNALGHARLAPRDIDYVNAHGTGTAHNDLSEWRGLSRVFGDRADGDLLISSSKSFLGHAQGAAGILELVTTIMGMERDRVPPTMHFCGARAHGPGDPVGQATPRPARVVHAASVNAGFGGSNAAVIVARADAQGDGPPLARRRPVQLLGVGAVGAFGTDVASLLAAIAANRPLSGLVADFRMRDIGLVGSPRRTDPLSRYLAAAASLAVRDAGVRIGKHNRGQVGLIAGISRLSPYSVNILNRSIDARGLARLSATAFPRMLLSAPTGTCTRLLEIQGSSSTISIGAGSGLAAVVYAAERLARCAEPDLLLAGGADEQERPRAGAEPGPNRESDRGSDRVSDQESGQGTNRGEGAACVLLGALAAEYPDSPQDSPPDSPQAGRGHRPVSVAGWAVAGPGYLQSAVQTALAMAGLAGADIGAVLATGPVELSAQHFGLDLPAAIDVAALLGRSECAASATAVVAAAATIRRGDADTVLVLDGLSESSACALVLTATDTLHE